MLDRSTVDRLRGIDTDGHSIVSLYLGLSPGLDQLRSITTRLKALVRPLRDLADSGDLSEEEARWLRADLDVVVGMADRVGADPGRGAAIFVSSAIGLDEHLSLPIPVRDRAVVGGVAYLGPLEAVLDHFHRYCAVVVDRRTASIYRFYLGELESWEEIAEEEVRKDNYGGFSGYDEQRVRGHAEVVAQRLFRTAVDRVEELRKEGRFEVLVVGGNQANVDGFLAELPATLSARLAGTFTIDPGTASPADVRGHCREQARAYDRRVDKVMVEELMDAAGAGARAVLGLDRALDAANQKAIDRLLIDAVETIPGVVCTECGWLAKVGGSCDACGAATAVVPDLFDSIAEAARADGGTVRYVLAATPLGRMEVGATVRFPVAGLRT